MIIGVPSGIGDISWVISKLINSSEWNDIKFEVADGWPYRADQYLSLLGKDAVYGDFSYQDIVVFQNVWEQKLGRSLRWDDIVASGASRFLLQPNHHLEKGLPLKDFLPDLETSYHYDLKLPEASQWVSWAETLMETEDWIGISAASYRGHKAWKTWGLKEWSELCKILIAQGFKLCFLGGSWDDLTMSLAQSIRPNVCINAVGKTSFGEACALHRFCKFYIGFSSGLGIIRTVMRLPTIMLWPEHQKLLSTSWADPEDIESRLYIALEYTTPRDVYNALAEQLRAINT